MVYVSILNQKEVDDKATYLNLRVVQGSGISVVPDTDINVSDLNNSKGLKYKHFFNSGDGGITIKIDIIILADDKINGVSVTDYINNLYVNMLPVSLVSDAIDIPKDPSKSTYIITKISNKKQTAINNTIWSLEFRSYTPLNLFRYANNNSTIQNALKKKKKSTKKASTIYTKLKKCNYKTLKYSKTKKVVPCVKYMQQVLYKQKLLKKNEIDGWYGKTTQKAVKKYQQQYNKKYKVTNIVQKNSGGLVKVTAGTLANSNSPNVQLPNGVKINNKIMKTKVNKSKPKISKRLNVTGKVDKATWIALYKGE